MLGCLVVVRATPGRWDSRRNRGGCGGRATATGPDMMVVVVTELELVNISVGRRWDGLSACETSADSRVASSYRGEGRRKSAHDAREDSGSARGDARLGKWVEF